MENNIVELKNISVEFDGESVLNNISLSIYDKEFVTLLGPSGCGKTTTLRLIAGFIEANGGDVLFEGKQINDLPPYKRNVNTIFQRYALFPHLNVFENVAFGLRVQKRPEREIRERVAEMLKTVNLIGFEKRRINTLSGGQQQRVAIARAVINQPKVLLLDEPLAALDLKLRKEMQLELKKIQKRLNITFIFVTHDQEEALTMSDRVVVMNAGEIMQIGTPQEIYNEPINAFVADFIGESNIVSGIIIKDFVVEFCNIAFDCVDKGYAAGTQVDVVVRPEDVRVVPPEKGQLFGTVVENTFKGVHYEMIVDVPGEEWPWIIHSTKAVPIGEKIGMLIEPDDIHIMNKSDIPLFSDLTEEQEGYGDE